MSDLILQMIKERSQLREHEANGELAEYGPNRGEELDELLTRLINHLTKGAEQDAA